MASRDKKDKERESKERKDRRDSRIASVSASVLELKTSKEPTAEAEAAGKYEGLDEKFDKFQNEMRGLFKKLDDSIDEKINNLNDKFTSRFDDLKVEIGALKTEIDGNTSGIVSINKTLRQHENSIEFHASQTIESEEKRKNEMKRLEKSVDEKIKLLDQKLMRLEKQDRKYNLLFYGIPEEAGEKLYDKMRRFFITDLSIEEEKAQSIHFVNGHRYPTKSGGPNIKIHLLE